jgi:hypothetical protein
MVIDKDKDSLVWSFKDKLKKKKFHLLFFLGIQAPVLASPEMFFDMLYSK